MEKDDQDQQINEVIS